MAIKTCQCPWVFTVSHDGSMEAHDIAVDLHGTPWQAHDKPMEEFVVRHDNPMACHGGSRQYHNM